MFSNIYEQNMKMAEQQREIAKKSPAFAFSKILNKRVRIIEKSFQERDFSTHEGIVTDAYEDYIELDNSKMISTKFIASIETL